MASQRRRQRVKPDCLAEEREPGKVELVQAGTPEEATGSAAAVPASASASF